MSTPKTPKGTPIAQLLHGSLHLKLPTVQVEPSEAGDEGLSALRRATQRELRADRRHADGSAALVALAVKDLERKIATLADQAAATSSRSLRDIQLCLLAQRWLADNGKTITACLLLPKLPGRESDVAPSQAPADEAVPIEQAAA